MDGALSALMGGTDLLFYRRRFMATIVDVRRLGDRV